MTNLAFIIAAYQQKHDILGLDLAKDIGIHTATLTRLRQGRMPDAKGMAKIMLWLSRESRIA